MNSIRFWLKAFDLVDENEGLNSLAENLFADNDWDPYLEDEATMWLLLDMLCPQIIQVFTVYFFNFRKIRSEFTKNHFSSLVNEIQSKQSN